jgi:hypothetical protein
MLGLLASPDAALANERFAFVVGNNEGAPDEPRLAFAERDAQRMADVLTRLGGVAPENVVLLLGRDATEVMRALSSLRSRLLLSSGGARPLMFVYYSGHADSKALHLRGTMLPFASLKSEVKALGADLSVIMVDACRSGGLLRKKGAIPAELFTIDATDTLQSEGLAIITSSAESEDAQESERLGGGIFTHHLVTGLSGAADTSGDQRVTLSEAYRYAYAQTLASTSTTAVVQHPTFSFDMQGHKELVMTQLDRDAGFGRLHLSQPGHYVVLERFGAREVAAELDARAGTHLVLRPGRYLVRRRETSAVFESERPIVAGQITELNNDDFARVPYRHAVRRGYGQVQRQAVSLGADFEVAGPLLPETGLLMAGAVSGQLDLADLALRLRLRFAQSTSDNAYVDMTQRLLGLDLGLYKLIDLGRHGLGFGVRLGVDWFAQRFEGPGRAPSKDQVVGRFGPFVRAEWALSSDLALQLDVGAEAYLMSVERGGERRGEGVLEPRVVPTIGLGFGVLLP